MFRTLVFASIALLSTHIAIAAPEAVTPAAKPGSAALLAASDDLLRQVSALRGLKIKGPVARGVLSRAEIGEKLKARIDKEYTPAEVSAEARVLRRLGLLPVSVDYAKLLLDLLTEQVAGFYDPTTRRLYIADWLPMEMQRPALAHELAHALQDQHFNLATFIRPMKDDGDRQLARAALVEGEGTALMLEMQAQAMRLPLDQLPDLITQLGDSLLKGGMGSAPIFEAAPTFLRETLIFPYFEGLRFVMAMRRGKTWKRIDEVWKSPPESTEQILHPDRYLSKDAPIAITAKPIAALAPRRELRRDVLGELSLRVLFRSRLPEPQADAAAAGWGGDRLVAYGDDKPNTMPTVIDLSIWDTETDAVEAATAFQSMFAKITGSTAAIAGPVTRYVDPNGETWRVERREREVLAIFGGPADDALVVAEAWAAIRPTAK